MTEAAVQAEARFPHDELVDPAYVGVEADALQRVVRQFRKQHEAGLFPGGQMVVRRHGHKILDFAIGLARGYRDEEPRQDVLPTTRFPCFSAGKAVVATLLAMVEERGLLDVKKPVAHYWPEFAQGGKQSITVLDYLTHRAGVLMPEFVKTTERWADWQQVVRAMEQAENTHTHGTIRYHPLEYGWVLAEVLHRTTGRRFREFFATELAGPAGLVSMTFGAGPNDAERAARPYYLGKSPVQIASFEVGRRIETLVLDPQVAEALVPGAGLVSDAASLAAFYELLVRDGRTRDGQQLLKPATIRRWTDKVVTGWCRTNQAPITLGRGFFVGGPVPDLWGFWGTKGVFGHAGMFCTNAFGDHSTGLAVAIVTNGNRSKQDLVQRMMPLSAGLRAACR